METSTNISQIPAVWENQDKTDEMKISYENLKTLKNEVQEDSDVEKEAKLVEDEYLEDDNKGGKVDEKNGSYEASPFHVYLKMEFSLEEIERYVKEIKGKEEIGTSEQSNNFASQLVSGLSNSKINPNEKIKEIAGKYADNPDLVNKLEAFVDVRHEEIYYANEKARLNIAMVESNMVLESISSETKDGYVKTHKSLVQMYSSSLEIDLEKLDRFNDQVKELDDENPEDAKKYVETTDKLAKDENVENDTLNSFFDTVDEYLDRTETNLVKVINDFFARLTSDFGFSKETADGYKDEILDDVTSFFDKAGSMLDNYKEKVLGVSDKTEKDEIEDNVDLVEIKAEIAETDKAVKMQGIENVEEVPEEGQIALAA